MTRKQKTAGQRSARARMRRGMAATLEGLLADIQGSLGPFALQQSDGIRLAASALGIELEENNDE